MKRKAAFIVFAAILLTLCACAAPKEQPASSVQNEAQTTPRSAASQSVSSDTPTDASGDTPTPLSSPSSAPSDDFPSFYEGVLYEDRYAFVDPEWYLPAKSDRILGGAVTTEIFIDSEEKREITVEGEEFSFSLNERETLTDAEGKELSHIDFYASGGRFVIGMRSSASYDSEGRLIGMSLTKSFLPETFGESDIRSTAQRIAAQLFGDELSGMECVFTSNVNDNSEIVKVKRFIEFREDAAFNSVSYTVSYFVPICGVKSGRYIDVTFSPYSAPLDSLTVRIGYDEIDDPMRALPALDTERLYDTVKNSISDLLADGKTASEVYLRKDTLLFTRKNGKPCVTIDAVITINKNQYDTGLCFVFADNALSPA